MTMKITKTEIAVRDLVKNYKEDKKTNEVVGYGKKLNIRPKYQREFVYEGKKEKQKFAVIETVMKGFPLNTVYWAKSDEEGFDWEVLDGQQRTISICRFCTNQFSIELKKGFPMTFANLSEEDQNKILDYKLDVYQCEGTDTEKLEWFKVINIAGEKLYPQELRNAVYSGEWLTRAKELFSKRTGWVYRKYKDLLSGDVIRQDYLETALSWIGAKEGKSIEEYMAAHQFDEVNKEGTPEGFPLFKYVKDVFDWVDKTFPTARSYLNEAKKVEWGLLYNRFGTESPDIEEINDEVSRLMMDSDVQKKSGIWEYVLSNDESALNIRTFDDNTKREVYERQNHKCPYCVREGNDKEYNIEDMEADHITPWSQGGKTTADNCQMLCKKHNRKKSDK